MRYMFYIMLKKTSLNYYRKIQIEVGYFSFKSIFQIV
jgi:hypothetical protein